MAEPRPSMLYVQQTGPQQDQQAQPQAEPQKPASIRIGFENVIRIAWTMTCFLVFCGFSFFLGWHLRGWHFSAYYEAPTVDLVGAKTAYHAPAPQQLEQLSQAQPRDKQ